MARAKPIQRRPLLGVLALTIFILVAGSFLSSPPWSTAEPPFGIPRNACGEVGRRAADIFLGGLGLPVAVTLLGAMFLLSVRWLFGRPRGRGTFFLWLTATAFVSSIFLSLVTQSAGLWGRVPAAAAEAAASGSLLGPLGAGILSGAALVALMFFGVPRWTPAPVARIVEDSAGELTDRAVGIPARLGTGLAGLRDRVAELPKPQLPKLSVRRLARSRGEADLEEEDFDDEIEESYDEYEEQEAPDPRRARVAPAVAERFAEPVARPARPERRGPTVPIEAADDELFEDEDTWEEDLRDPLDEVGDLDSAVVPTRITDPTLPTTESLKKTHKKRRRGNSVLPPLHLLEEPQPLTGVVSKTEVLEKSQILVKTLEDFNIQGSIGEVHPGPVITQYEYAPAAGVRISQIVSRSDDLALNMRAARIRIVAPIPGKAAIGIEVPNDTAAHIDFRTIMQELDLSDAALPLCLGRDIRGRAQYGRLEKMPHLLVAGTTGSGKSVCLNTCIFSLLYSRTPEELRLLMIDPKMLELTVYDGIPHLLCPVVTDARMASRMLQWMVGEMERRYRKMATLGVRNIQGYHDKVKARGGDQGEPMPYIVVVVDELADLMLTLGNEIETPIARLAQMARAVGIHLILATQRPSVDVITGVIKANFPGRIAFQVATKVDSRTILDVNGAENLLGRGDMLYLPPGKGSPVRLHGAYVSDDDAGRLVEFLKTLPEPEPVFREEMLDKETDGNEIDDELFEDALRLVVVQQQASVSFLQRRLKVGYSRAGRLMDLLEGVRAVGPHEGSKPREVYADEKFLKDWQNEEAKTV